jgi:hypothetical protein
VPVTIAANDHTPDEGHDVHLSYRVFHRPIADGRLFPVGGASKKGGWIPLPKGGLSTVSGPNFDLSGISQHDVVFVITAVTAKSSKPVHIRKTFPL